MNRRGPLMVLLLLVGCARGSADLLDASIGPIQGSDGGTSDEGDVIEDESDGADEGADGADADGDARDGDGDIVADDAADSDGTDADADGDADGSGMDAAVPEDDASQPSQPIVADFRVQQRHAALAAPLATNLTLRAGDTVRITGGGNIWPGLVLQGCNGPTGTSGSHSGAGWPLQGGPDFALVAFVNGAWTFVGNDRTFDVTVAGSLQLGTNDDDPGTGDDCNDVSESERGFSAHVVITPAP